MPSKEVSQRVASSTRRSARKSRVNSPRSARMRRSAFRWRAFCRDSPRSGSRPPPPRARQARPARRDSVFSASTPRPVKVAGVLAEEGQHEFVHRLVVRPPGRLAVRSKQPAVDFGGEGAIIGVGAAFILPRRSRTRSGSARPLHRRCSSAYSPSARHCPGTMAGDHVVEAG